MSTRRARRTRGEWIQVAARRLGTGVHSGNPGLKMRRMRSSSQLVPPAPLRRRINDECGRTTDCVERTRRSSRCDASCLESDTGMPASPMAIKASNRGDSYS